MLHRFLLSVQGPLDWPSCFSKPCTTLSLFFLVGSLFKATLFNFSVLKPYLEQRDRRLLHPGYRATLVCVCACECVLPGCLKSLDSNQGEGKTFSLPLSLSLYYFVWDPSLWLIVSTIPGSQFNFGSPVQSGAATFPYFLQMREDGMINVISGNTGSVPSSLPRSLSRSLPPSILTLFFLLLLLSFLWTWSTNPSLRCCYVVVVVVVRLPWRWAVSRSEPRIRLRRV